MPGRRERGPPRAYDAALGLLARREHSARELKEKLTRRGVDPAERDSALAALHHQGYQDDERYAAAVVRRRLAAGYGPRRIIAELAAHGIARARAEALLGGVDWAAEARSALARRRRSVADEAGRRRQARWLALRGFPPAAIRRALGVDADAEPD